jgi:membrane associated rhomboid family serine protease
MTSWVLRLIIANVFVFLLTMSSPAIVDNWVFVPALILLRPWTIITYMFLHASFGHIFFNMLALFFFGPRLEIVLGGKKFLLLYFISGISGGLLSFFFTPHAAILGASGAVYGVMMGFAFFWPTEPMYIWGILPVQSRWLIVFMTLLSLYGGFGADGGGIAHFAHLGGFLGGYLYLRINRRMSEQHLVPAETKLPSLSETDLARWSNIPREKLHQVNREELDRILDKIKSNGIGTLTFQERAFLDRFSQIS